MIRDLDLTNRFGELYEKQVILYGAGYNGRIALGILKRFGVVPEAFCDSDPSLKGKKIGEIEIKSIEELLSIDRQKEIIIIVTTGSDYYEEIISILLDNKVKCKQIYTFSGLLYAAYFNLDLYGKNHELSSARTIWLHNQRLKVGMMQASSELYQLLFEDTEAAPIIVYQPGKVGSNTVAYSLQQQGKGKVFHSHGISYPSINSEAVDMRQCLMNCIKSSPKIKMITLVREPISKDIGHFFQKIDLEYPDAGWFVKGLMEKNFQRSFLNYLSVITPFDFTEDRKKDELEKKEICHIDAVGQRNKKGAFWGWFDEELKNNFGIDILNEEFDVERGYSVIQSGNIELLIMKLERLNQLEEVIGQFVGIDNFKLKSINKAETKSYRYAYEQFKKEVILPQKYIDFYYQNNAYTNHFYSESEREKYYRKWEKYVK